MTAIGLSCKQLGEETGIPMSIEWQHEHAMPLRQDQTTTPWKVYSIKNCNSEMQ